jgi:hypothetical protein
VAAESVRELARRAADSAAHVEDPVRPGDFRGTRQGKSARNSMPVVIVDRRELFDRHLLRIDPLAVDLPFDGVHQPGPSVVAADPVVNVPRHVSPPPWRLHHR